MPKLKPQKFWESHIFVNQVLLNSRVNLVDTSKPFADYLEIEREVKFDAISSTFNKLFDNLIGFM